MIDRVDVAIVGGGCAGLSLAVHLAEQRVPRRKVVVLESRERYVRDRTWCGWSVRPHRFSSCVSHRWERWAVRTSGAEVVRGSRRFAYEHVPADAFYGEALDVVRGAEGFELRTSTDVHGLHAEGGTVRVETSDGALEAGLVVDARPGQPPPEGALLQHFEGWHVRCARPTFQPDVVTLMDFDVPQDRGIHFFYVLPFSETEALVEATFLSPQPLNSSEYATVLRGYLARLGAPTFEVAWRERGVIPMAAGRPAPSPSPRILRVGGAGGATRPSSGYGFANIQRTTEALAARIESETVPRPVPPRSLLEDRMDSVFLSFLQRYPERAPRMFAQLFRAVSPEPLARFLMEESAPLDRLRVVGAMPKLPFMRAALTVGAG